MAYADMQTLHFDASKTTKKREVGSPQRLVSQMESLVSDLERRADELDREIKFEEDRAGIDDSSHYAYPTYAKAAILRRDNLRRSAHEVRAELQKLQKLQRTLSL